MGSRLHSPTYILKEYLIVDALQKSVLYKILRPRMHTKVDEHYNLHQFHQNTD